MNNSKPAKHISNNQLANELAFESTSKITLRCGGSAIELLPNGTIILKGKAILQQAEKSIKLLGERIELN